MIRSVLLGAATFLTLVAAAVAQDGGPLLRYNLGASEESGRGPAAQEHPPEASLVVARHTAVFTRPPRNVPTNMMPDGPLLGNGDLGVVVAGPPEDQRFYLGKNDFWRRPNASIVAVGSVSLSIPAMEGASYRQELDLARAEVRGRFAKGSTTLHSRSWVAPSENLLVTELRCEGGNPVTVSLRQVVGGSGAVVPARVTESDAPLIIGREQYGGGRWYFNGRMADVSVVPKALSADAIAAAAAKRPEESAATAFDGRQDYQKQPRPTVGKAVTVSAWVRIGRADKEANYIVSRGEWNRAYSLGLSGGHLRWAINGTYVQTPQPLPLGKWIHVAGTFDGRRMCVFLDGVLKASLGRDVNGGTVDQKAAESWFTHAADTTAGSRKAAVVTRVLGAVARLDTAGRLTVVLKPGETVTLGTAVRSDLDAKDCLASARGRVTDLKPADIVESSSRNSAWWADFWARSFIDIPDKEIEKRWYAALYVMGSCSRPGKVAPGLWGNWITTDRPAWHGDFHLNYNFEAPYYIVYASNHADLSLPFYQAMLQALPNGRVIAKKRGWKGVHLPVSIGPWGLMPEGPDSDWGQRSNAAFAAMNFIWYYQYTQDTDFLRTTAWPYLLGVADFWEDYLKLEGGRYVILNDSIHEGSGADTNPLLSLGLVRTLFANMLRMSEDLSACADRRVKWRDICDRISAFPVQQRGGKTVFRYSEKGTAWWPDNTLGIHHIFPAGAIGLDSDPKLIEISRNTIEAMGRWTDNNGFSSWYTACARVGYDPTTILAKLRRECDTRCGPNLLPYYGGGGIENVAGFLAVNEMLLQSHDGVIRLFPCWPKGQNARFGGLRAVGAFLVSAERKGDVVSGLRILSEKGRDCTVVNPWPGEAVRAVRNGKAAETMRGARFTLKTTSGKTVELIAVQSQTVPAAAQGGR